MGGLFTRIGAFRLVFNDPSSSPWTDCSRFGRTIAGVGAVGRGGGAYCAGRRGGRADATPVGLFRAGCKDAPPPRVGLPAL